jgi:hypothetical protein
MGFDIRDLSQQNRGEKFAHGLGKRRAAAAEYRHVGDLADTARIAYVVTVKA